MSITAASPTLFEWMISARFRGLAWTSGIVFLFSLLTGLLAQLALPLGWTPVPVTGQTLAVFLTGFVLGPRLGPLAMLLYLFEGLAGFPVFAAGGAGLGHLLGPTGGYLLSYPLVAGLVGWLATRGWDRHPFWTGLAMALGSAVIFLFGLTWLAVWTSFSGHFAGLSTLLKMGMLPFLPGDLLKAIGVMLLLPGAWRLVR